MLFIFIYPPPPHTHTLKKKIFLKSVLLELVEKRAVFRAKLRPLVRSCQKFNVSRFHCVKNCDGLKRVPNTASHAAEVVSLHTTMVLALKTDTETCLLYTSDAADEALSVDLGGRRIIKKKIF